MIKSNNSRLRSIMTLETKVQKLISAEIRSSCKIEDIESSWVKLIDDCDDSVWEVLVAYNKFRLRNLEHVKIERPAIIIGAVNDSHFPNFHTVELLKFADVVSLTTQKNNTDDIDRLYYSIVNDSFQDIIKRLPTGFKPICFWDSQAEHSHPQPMGLSDVPFATVASICHIFHSPAINRLLEIFDYVLPVGRVFDQYLSKGKSKILKIPFGLNWASMHHFNKSDVIRKDVDVSLTFGSSEDPVYRNLRNEILTKTKIFQQKYSEKFNIVIESNLENKRYTELLNRSKISINVVGINGPYNYRTCEIMNAGALLFQSNVSSHNISPDAEELFFDGEDYIGFNVENFEGKLLSVLNDKEKIVEIAQNGKKKLEEKFNYKNLFLDMIKQVQNDTKEQISDVNFEVKDKMNLINNFNLGAFLWEQYQKPDLRVIGAGLVAKILPQFDTLRFFTNLLAILPELLDKFGFDFVFSLIERKNKQFADTLDTQSLQGLVIKIYSLFPDHVAMVHNMISILIENNLIDRGQLPSLVNQAFVGKEWKDYHKGWLLRYPILNDNLSSEIRYEKLSMPLVLAKNNADEWKAYRDYLLSISNL